MCPLLGVLYSAHQPSESVHTLFEHSDPGKLCSLWLYYRAARDAMLARYMLSSCVCLSVLLPVRHKHRHYTRTAKRRITQTTPYDSPGMFFWRRRSRRNSIGVTPNGGAKYRCGQLQSAIFDQYLAISQKRCKIGHSYYGTHMETRMRLCWKEIRVYPK